MMPDKKQFADLITGARLLLALFYCWLGYACGASALSFAAWLLLANWTGDSVDGALARRSHPYRRTWLGDHDLQVDMLVATGLLVFLVTAGFVPVMWAVAYFVSWLAVFALGGATRSLGMLAQAPIYGCFIWVALRYAPPVGWPLVIWILAGVLITWPRFPREVVPGFLAGLRRPPPDKHSSPGQQSSH